MSVKERLVPRPTGRRLVTLGAGLTLFGISLAMLVEAGLGLAPWDVLHQGLADTFGVRLGAVVIAVSLVVLVLWIPLRQRPGVGTLANAVVVGVVAEASLALLPTPDGLGPRAALLAGGVLVNAIGTGMYIGAGLGPGPRDGLMTGLARTRPIRAVRTSIEVVVLALGWLLGGTIGIGTLVFAAAIGPLVHLLLPPFTIPTTDTSHDPAAPPEENPTWQPCPAS